MVTLGNTFKGQENSLYFSFFYGDKYIVDFQVKCEIFSSLFDDQCLQISNGSLIPSGLPLQKDSALSFFFFILQKMTLFK